MSKKSKLAAKQLFIAPHDGEALTGDQAKQFELANRLLNMAANEASVMFLLKFWLETNALARIFSLPKISRWKFEMTVEYGRIDLALFHVNGDITIVEAKAGLDVHATVAGIGQLFLYESAIKIFPNNKKTKIRKVLCAQCRSEHMEVIVESCARAGISFVPMPRIDLVRGIAYEHLIAGGDHGL